MNEQARQGVPRPTLLRLPSYYRVLRSLADGGRQFVSCTHIAAALRLDPTQVRKDLAATQIVGRPKVGYSVAELMKAISAFLGWDNASAAFLVGAGSLGTALMGYGGFKEHGLDIVAAFDADPAKHGRQVHGREVLPLEKLPDLAERMHVRIGVLAVPAEAAQDAVNVMVLAGLRAIWNFTPVRLDVPDGTIVENVQLAGSLSVLMQRLNETLRKEQLDGAVNDGSDRK